MATNRPRLYRARLWMAKCRRHLNQWILRRLFKCLEKLTKRQLSLLSQRENLLNQLSQNQDSQQQERLMLERQLLLLNLQYPMALDQTLLLEDLQLLSRALITKLQVGTSSTTSRNRQDRRS